MATQSDDIAALTQLVTRVLTVHGLAEQTRLATGVSLSELAKASGATPEAVGMWLTGRATPTQRQAIAAFGLLYERAAWREAAGNGEADPGGAAVAAVVASAAPATPRRARR